MSNKLEVLSPTTLKVMNASGFKTAFGDTPMLPRQNYFFMIKIVKGGFVKIGVAKKDDTPFDIAFCDKENGWALYNGELRNNSNCQGKPYALELKGGSRAEEGDVVGVLVERKEYGRIAFIKNGKYMGVAFEDPALKDDNLYAAIAPIYINHIFQVVNPMPED